MAGNTVDQPSQIQAGPAAGAAMIGANTRVRGKPGTLGTALDSLVFSGGSGAWAVTNTRTRIQGVPMVSATSTGVANLSGVGAATVLVTAADPRIRSR